MAATSDLQKCLFQLELLYSATSKRANPGRNIRKVDLFIDRLRGDFETAYGFRPTHKDVSDLLAAGSARERLDLVRQKREKASPE